MGNFVPQLAPYRNVLIFRFKLSSYNTDREFFMCVPCGVKGYSEIRAVDSLFFKFTVTCFKSHTLMCRTVTYIKPNSLTLTIIRVSVCFWAVFRVTFSTCWPITDNRLIGRIFCKNLGSLPDMGKLLFLFSSKMSGNVTTRDSG